MHPSLQAISEKAGRLKDYRFLNLYTMLNETFLVDSWRYINKQAARGIDGISARDYEKDLEANVSSVVDQLKRKSYRAKLVKRHYIPKGNGKTRPLGIPAVSDKLLQMAVSRILGAIFEPDFLAFSYGYRPGRGAQEGVGALTYQLQYGWYGYVVEADIRGFFDNIDHDWLIRMLSERINDGPFLRLIRKWLNAGILDTDGQVLHPVTGTPQGGVISPVLANVYLHHVLDLWFEKAVKPHCKGDVYLCRYADDFVCLFRYKEDADRFYKSLPERLAKFGLSVSPGKTRIVPFSRHKMPSKSRFDFLGFEFRWGKTRWGRPQIKRRTSRKKLQQAVRNFTLWCKASRHWPLEALFVTLNMKLRGYYNYYGVIGNIAGLRSFFASVRRILFKWLNRRSQRHSYTWPQFGVLLARYKLLPPRITEKRYRLRAEQLSC